MTGTNFSSISVSRWRQFKSVELKFAPGVTILTGRNGTGKTSILNILAQHSSWSTTFIAAPTRTSSGGVSYLAGFWDWLFGKKVPPSPMGSVGHLTYSNGTTSDLTVSSSGGVEFNISIPGQQPVRVLNIPSHRRLPTYRRVDQIPTSPITHQEALSNYQNEFWNSLRGAYTTFTPLSRMKEALISMAILGKGNDIVRPNEEAFSVFQDFERRLKQVIPRNIGFRRIAIEMPDVVLETDSGRFLLDASSGGLMSLIDLTWQITLFGRADSSFVVIIDEPENHLHPSMQREFLPAFVEAFPQAQFIVATHSPFIVSSMRDAVVYAFDVEEQDEASGESADDLSGLRNAVIAVPVDIENRTSASEVLRKVLGVPVTVPIWAEQELDEVAGRFADLEITPEVVINMQAALAERGLKEFLSDTVARAIQKNAQVN